MSYLEDTEWEEEPKGWEPVKRTTTYLPTIRETFGREAVWQSIMNDPQVQKAYRPIRRLRNGELESCS